MQNIYEVDIDRLTWSAVAAWVVILGVVLKNGIQQAGWGDMIAVISGTPVFVIGWILVAVALSKGKTGQIGKQAAIWVSSVVIVVTALAASAYMSKDEPVPIAFPILFGLAWLLLGWMSGNTLMGSVVGLMGGLVVIAATVFLLPLQRWYDVVDGPGMPLYVLGWTLLVFAHSIVGYRAISGNNNAAY
jgi:hypothetical protein